MARCYLMIEDTDAGGVVHAIDYGVKPEELPEDYNDLTPAQELTHKFSEVIRSTMDPAVAAHHRQQQSRQVVVPAHIAEEDQRGG